MALADAAFRGGKAGRGLAVPVSRSAYLSPCRTSLQPRESNRVDLDRRRQPAHSLSEGHPVPGDAAKATCSTICPAHGSSFTWHSGIMDPEKTLNEWVEKTTILRAECEKDLKLKLQVHRSDSDIMKRQEKQKINKYITSQRKLLDSASSTEQNDISMAMKVSLRDLLAKALHDQCAASDEKIKQERAVFNQAISKALEAIDACIHQERANVDLIIKQAWEKMDKGLVNERSNLNSLIESLIEKDEVRAGMNDKEQDGVYIPRNLLGVLMDNECDQNVVMRFKVHLVKERYPDLQKYFDSREDIGQFTITKPNHTSVEFVVMLENLREFGYRGSAELYYLDPTPGSVPSTGLQKIDGQEEVNEMVVAHDIRRTKICHLYLVGPEQEVLDDDMADDNGEDDAYNND